MLIVVATVSCTKDKKLQLENLEGTYECEVYVQDKKRNSVLTITSDVYNYKSFNYTYTIEGLEPTSGIGLYHYVEDYPKGERTILRFEINDSNMAKVFPDFFELSIRVKREKFKTIIYFPMKYYPNDNYYFIKTK